MKNAITVVVLAATAFMAGAAFADDAGLALAKQKQCLGCHDVSMQKLAPTFKEIARTYKKATPAMEGALITQIISGSSTRSGYHWGDMKMPPSNGPRPTVSIMEANILLDWILSLN